jgi:hypothetical protein
MLLRMKRDADHPPAAYRRLQERLARVGWVALGSVVERAETGRGGPRYQWTRRVDGKTITVALSAEQFRWMKGAIANQRRAWELLDQMHRLSLAHMWKTLPNASRRKPLSHKKMGIN